MRTKQSREDREAKLAALHERLTDAVNALVTGDDWRRALEFAARFRSRSFKNVLLIHQAMEVAYAEGLVPTPIPTYVAGFRQWQTLGRSVMKGQPGIQILAPVTGRYATATPTDPDSWRRLRKGERPCPGETAKSKMIGLRPAYVWDITQTDGDPIPTPPGPKLLEGAAPEGLWDALADDITSQGYGLRLVSDARHLGGANGITDFVTREVSVRTDMDESAMVRTLAHEAGHVALHAPTDAHEQAAKQRGMAEVDVESVSMMVTARTDRPVPTPVPDVSTWPASITRRVLGRSRRRSCSDCGATGWRCWPVNAACFGRSRSMGQPAKYPPVRWLERQEQSARPSWFAAVRAGMQRLRNRNN